MSTIVPAERVVVLVAEDEFLSREDSVEFLGVRGFEALGAADADQALAVIAEKRDIDALFTDVNMPRGSIDGLGLAREVSANWPGIAILVTSGQTVRQVDLPEGARFLSKPYRPDAVVRALKMAIDGRSGLAAPDGRFDRLGARNADRSFWRFG